MSKKRLYRVSTGVLTTAIQKHTVLVRATSQASAARAAIDELVGITVAVATTNDVEELLPLGKPIEAKDDEAPPPHHPV